MLHLVKTLFLSKLSYASHIWITTENIKEINKLWYHILKSITGAVLNISMNVAELILGVPPILIQNKINSVKHFLKVNNRPVQNDRYKEFLQLTYNEAAKSPSIIHKKYKDTFKFLEWKVYRHPSHFNIDDLNIVNNKRYNSFTDLSEKACTYSKDMITRYTESLWQSTIRNQFQLDGYPTPPIASCDSVPVPQNTPRKIEVALISMFYKNNILNQSLYKLSKVESPKCSFCSQHEETAEHLLFKCIAVEEQLRTNAYRNYRLANNLQDNDVSPDSYIALLNASKHKPFISSCIEILKNLNLKVTVDL